jgi:hypothetical protein
MDFFFSIHIKNNRSVHAHRQSNTQCYTCDAPVHKFKQKALLPGSLYATSHSRANGSIGTFFVFSYWASQAMLVELLPKGNRIWRMFKMSDDLEFLAAPACLSKLKGLPFPLSIYLSSPAPGPFINSFISPPTENIYTPPTKEHGCL